MDAKRRVSKEDEEMVEAHYLTAKTSVWWDVDNRRIPAECDPSQIAPNIRSALAAMGYSGEVTISAYGQTGKIPDSVQQALNSTGITLYNVSHSGQYARRLRILVEMMAWAADNNPPANYLLCSENTGFFIRALHILRRRGFHILVGQEDSPFRFDYRPLKEYEARLDEH